MLVALSVGIAVALAAMATPAHAEIRTLTATLPSDAQPTISGIPDNPDLRQLHIVYDTTGSVTITVDFWHPINGVDTSQNYAFSGAFSIGTAVGMGSDIADDTYCDSHSSGGLDGDHHVFSTVETFYDQATVSGFGGTLSLTRTVSPDNMEITLTASNSALANHNWTCATYTLYARARSTAGNLSSSYDASCDCWFVTHELDTISPLPATYFDGFAPLAPQPPPPPPPPPAPNCSVPSLIGLSLARAKSSLITAHCGLGKVGRAYSLDYESGVVISQDQAKRTVLPNGSPVDVVLSLGPKLSRADALYYMTAAVKGRFSRQPQRLKLTSCARVRATTWQCSAAWRDRTFHYRGKVRTWIDVKYYYYSFDVKRTRLDCTHNCVRHIAVHPWS
jgi:hypothetical protein